MTEPEDHLCRKRPVDKLENSVRINKSNQSIYINNKSTYQAQLKKVQKAVDSGFNEIFIHATGGSITRASQIALQINKENYDCFDIWPYTDTITVQDDMEPLHDEAESFKRSRLNPALHIRLVLKSQ